LTTQNANASELATTLSAIRSFLAFLSRFIVRTYWPTKFLIAKNGARSTGVACPATFVANYAVPLRKINKLLLHPSQLKPSFTRTPLAIASAEEVIRGSPPQPQMQKDPAPAN
jgi:hypothetical protein